MLIDSSSDHRSENVLRSPCKGAVLPKSTSSAVSPLVRRSLGSLPSSLSHPTSDPLHARRQLISPQITKWFRKSTPRKLAVTPKKSSTSTREAKSSVTRVKRKLCSEPDTNDSQAVALLAVKLERPSNENEPKLSPSKRQRTEPCLAVNVLSPVDSNCDKQSEQVLDKISSDASSASNTAQSSVTSALDTVATSFHSPTVNLPNYVYDPQPRAPVGRHLSPAKRRQSLDWLTQLRLERQNSSMQRSPPSLAHRGHTRHRTTKVLKSSPQTSHSDGSAVKASSSAPNTKAVSTVCICVFCSIHNVVFIDLLLCRKIAELSSLKSGIA